MLIISAGSMLLKAKLGGVQRFIRIAEPNLTEFLIAGKKCTLWNW